VLNNTGLAVLPDVPGQKYSEYMMEKQGYLGQIEVTTKPAQPLNTIQQAYLDFTKGLELVPIYDIQMDGAVIDVMNSKLQELLAGTATPQAVADAIQAEQAKLAKS